MEPLIFTYAVYTSIAVVVTAVLAHMLFRNGALFFQEVFDDVAIGRAVNRLLVVGFYMLNLGYGFLLFRGEEPLTRFDAVTTLTEKLGALLLSLGVIHFINMGVFWRIRKTALEEDEPPATYTAIVPPPPAPASYTPPAPVPAAAPPA